MAPVMATGCGITSCQLPHQVAHFACIDPPSERRLSEMVPHGGDQRFRINGFLKELRRETIRVTRRVARERRDDENGEVRSLQFFVKKNVPAADPRHAEIRDQQTRLGVLSREPLERLLAAQRRDDVPAFEAEHAMQRVADRRIVVDEQDRGGDAG
jgi:hypothetical protein